MGRTFQVFLDHVPADEALAQRLVHHLLPLVGRQIRLWHPGAVLAGTLGAEEARQALDRADVAVFLYSAYVNGTPVYERMLLAHERHREGSLHLLPVLARSCALDPEDFPRLRPLLAGRIATDYPTPDDACHLAVAEIQRLLDVLTRHPYGARPTLGTVAADAFRLDRRPQWEEVKRRSGAGQHTLFLLYGRRGQAVTYFARRVGELLQQGKAPLKVVEVAGLRQAANQDDVENRLRWALARELGEPQAGDLRPLLSRQSGGQRLFLLLGEAQRWPGPARQAVAAFFSQRLPALLPRAGQPIQALLMFEYEREEDSLRPWIDGWASELTGPLHYCRLPEAKLPEWEEVLEVLRHKGADEETIAAVREFYDRLKGRESPSFQELADALDEFLS